MDAPLQNPARRFPELDGLRGLAALMVALSHYVLAFQPALLGGGPAVAHFPDAVAMSRTPIIALFNPELGVAIFFVLSGFVLAASAARTDASFPALIVRRWARLALPVLGTSLLIWPLAEWRLFYSVEAAGMAKSNWLAGNYAWLSFEKPDLPTLVWQSLVDLFARANHFYNTALWTMPTEFRGSIALFAVVALARWRTRDEARRAWLGLAASMIALGFVWKTAYFGFPCGVALFEAGRLLPRMRRTGAAAGAVLLGLGLVFGGMPFLLVAPFADFYGRIFLALAPFIDNPVLLLHRVAAMCVVAAALLSGPMRAALNTMTAQRLGRVSFMLYLVHVPLLCSPIAWLLLHLAPMVGYDAATGLLLPVFLAAAFAMAAICTRWIDAPTLRLIQRSRATQGSRSAAATNLNDPRARVTTAAAAPAAAPPITANPMTISGAPIEQPPSKSVLQAALSSRFAIAASSPAIAPANAPSRPNSSVRPASRAAPPAPIRVVARSSTPATDPASSSAAQNDCGGNLEAISTVRSGQSGVISARGSQPRKAASTIAPAPGAELS